jgi:VIT1/CCC1 family predicted Fe2+/Mn2+ transporter
MWSAPQQASPALQKAVMIQVSIILAALLPLLAMLLLPHSGVGPEAER